MISSALIIILRMFEHAEKFIAFTPYRFVAFRIFSTVTEAYNYFSLPLLNQHGDP